MSTITRILENHGVQWTEGTAPGTIGVYEYASRRDAATGIVSDASSWVTIPATVAGVKRWLGY